jgi:hypothetical protein
MKYFKVINAVLPIFLIVIFFCDCAKWPKRRYALVLWNREFYEIEFLISKVGVSPVYPDTSLSMQMSYFRKVTPQVSAGTSSSVPWAEIFAYQPSDTMSIYIVHPDTLAKYTWNTIQATYNILQRYDISAQDYENRKGVFEYPYDSTLGKLKVFRK